jgi:hypothetical protein
MSMNTLDFLTALYGADPAGTIVINSAVLTSSGGTFYKTHIASHDLDAGKYTSHAHRVSVGALALDSECKPGESIYHRITTLAPDWSPDCGLTVKACKDRGECRGTHRGSAKESFQAPGLFFDADVSTGDHKDGVKPADWAEFRAVLEKAGMPPETSLVSSGGGFYPGWVHAELVDLTEPGVYDRYAAMQQGLHGLVNAWSLHLGVGKLDATFDLARVLRLPGSRNRKTKYGPDGRLCEVVHFDGPRYSLEELEAVLAAAEYPAGHFAPKTRAAAGRAKRAAESEHDSSLFDEASSLTPITEAQAWDRIEVQLDKCRTVLRGEGAQGTFGGAARRIGLYVQAGVLTAEQAADIVVDACKANPHQDPAWYGAAADQWTIETVVGKGLENGLADEPQYELVATTGETMPAGTPEALPPLEVKSPASMTMWLQENIGAGHLSGMFNRGGAVVYTPAVGSSGYIAPKEAEEDSGPMQVRAVSKIGLAAQVQFSYQCFKIVDETDENGEKTGNKVETDALFPAQAAELVIAAPEHMPKLRTLRGVTHTPIMRKDGSILDRPGFDAASGLLYAPARGLQVEAVPENPTTEEIGAARDFVLNMVADFPFVSLDDRANWLGMMLTPLMREVVSSDRKLFAVNAHQAGSGKTLLAKLGQYTHGAVFRSALPEDEAEMRKWATGVLSTTTAPMVIADNVTGTLRSAFLAGLLTSQTLSDRVLGKTEDITVPQDRMWVITGNNVQIGADISRRLVTIAIDPGMERPEERTGFAISNLEAYAVANRGRTLSALLTLMRAWVVAGRPMESKDQSDSFQEWEAAVGGILSVAQVAGEFNTAKTRATVRDTDREEFGDFLEKLFLIFGEKEFLMRDLLAKCGPEESDSETDGFIAASLGVRELGPSDMPSSRLAEQLKADRLSSKGLGKLMGCKTKQYHNGFALVAGEKGRNGVPWSIKATDEAKARVEAYTA